MATMLVAVLAHPASAQQITPSAAVIRNVAVRAAPDADAPTLRVLAPGERLPKLGDQPRWYRVRLPTGADGYVSKAWTDEVADTRPPAPADPVYRIHAVDVGTGLALLVEGPDFTLIYDAGSNDDAAQGPNNRFLAYLKKVKPGLRTIDHVVLSHPHEDHVSLLRDVFQTYGVREVWDSGRAYDTCVYRYFLTEVAREPEVIYHQVQGGPGSRRESFPRKCSRDPETITLNRGAPISVGPVRLGAGAAMSFLHRDAEPYDDPNGNSLVARLDLGPVRVLLTGDAEAGDRCDVSDPDAAAVRMVCSDADANSVEGRLLACCAAALQADVMFAGHHGSLTSSRTKFLDAVAASVFVISAGPFPYKGKVLPDPPVVVELARRGAVWRTDIDDAACRTNTAKLGRDGKGPGGCDNIVITIHGATVSVANTHPVD